MKRSNGGVQPNKLPAEKEAEIVRLLRAGLTVPQICKRVGVSKSQPIVVARRNGVTNYALGKAGRPAGSMSKQRRKEVVRMSVATDTNYRGMASNARWGNKLGAGWL